MNLNLVAHATRSSLDRLYEVLDGASSNPAGRRFDLVTRITKLYRQLGVGEFLLEGDAQDLYEFLQLGVQACDDLLREVSPEDVATSRLLAWFDAVCVGDRDAMASIAARAPRECNPRKEYEEDFLYMRIAMDAVGLGRPVAEVEPMLARLRELSADRRDARAELLVAFLGGDVSAFVAALRALCEEHDAFYGEIVPASLVEERRILRHLPPLEVVAWLALARRSTMPDAELAEVPAALLEECAVPRPPPRRWLEYSHPHLPRQSDGAGRTPERVVLESQSAPESPSNGAQWSLLRVDDWTDPDYGVVGDLPSELSELRHQLETGEPVAASWPSPCAVRLDPYRGGRWLRDVIANGDDLVICSARVTAVIESACRAACEYLPLTILDHKGRIASSDHVLIHPLGVHDRPASLPPLSRMSQVSDAYVVSPALSDALRRIPGVTNLLLEPTDMS